MEKLSCNAAHLVGQSYPIMLISVVNVGLLSKLQSDSREQGT